MQVATADAGSAHGDDHVARPGHGIGELFQGDLTVACEYQPLHAARLSARFGQPRQSDSDQKHAEGCLGADVLMQNSGEDEQGERHP